MSHKITTPKWALVYSGAEFLIVHCVRMCVPDEGLKSALFISRPIPVNDISTPMVSIILYMLLGDETDLAKECPGYQDIHDFVEAYEQGSMQTPVGARSDVHASQIMVSEVCTLVHVRMIYKYILGRRARLKCPWNAKRG
jgi:hypothetical protein